jgi:hypothetical protein
MPYLLDWDDPDIPQHKRAEYHRILRAIPSGRKMEAACELMSVQRDVLAAGVRALFPGISGRDITAKLAWLWLPDALWKKVYGKCESKADKE